MKPLIYADHAATTRLDPEAFEAMKPFLLEEYGNASQPYSFAGGPRQALKEARALIAHCIHADPEEIFFTSGGTEGDNWAIKETVRPTSERNAVITSQIEHHAVLRACETLEKRGCPVTRLPVTGEGLVTPASLEAAISPATRLVSVMLANNEIGTIQPIRELCRIAHRHGALFHTDAVQALGHVPIDVRDLGVDLLSASAHKCNGPKGVGFLYIKKGTPIAAYADGGTQERGMRAGTENIAAIVGMAVALRANCDTMAQNTAHLRGLEARLLERLSSANRDFIRNGSPAGIPGNLSLSFRHADGEALLHRLDLKGICVSTGAACDADSTRLSHVLEAIGLPECYARGTIRVSLGKSNTREEAERIAEALNSILDQVF